MCKQERAALPAVMKFAVLVVLQTKATWPSQQRSQLCLSCFSDTFRNRDLRARSIVTSFELLA